MIPETARARMRTIQENWLSAKSLLVEHIPLQADDEAGMEAQDPEYRIVTCKLFEGRTKPQEDSGITGAQESVAYYTAHVPYGSGVLSSDRVIIGATVLTDNDTGLYVAHSGGEYFEIESVADLDEGRTVDKLYLLKVRTQ